jgi:hypothetical protein
VCDIRRFGRFNVTLPRKDEPVFAEFWYRLYPEWRCLQSREERREVKRLFGKRPRVVIQTIAFVIPMALAVSLHVSRHHALAHQVWNVDSIGSRS